MINQWKFKTTVISLSLMGMAGLLSSCTGGDSMGDPNSWGNFKCTAINPSQEGYSVMGWATNRKEAEQNAMNKCQATSAAPAACRIGNCYNDM